MTDPARDPLAIRTEAAAVWELPALEDIPVVSSSRMRTSLGLFHPRRMQVRLASFLAAAPVALYREVVIHEFAHAAVLLVHGRGRKPHGREWRGFMLSAGMTPRVRLPRGELQALLPPGALEARKPWLHRCPVCQAARTAARPMRSWCCSVCRKAGLEGTLVIERVAAASEGAAP